MTNRFNTFANASNCIDCHELASQQFLSWLNHFCQSNIARITSITARNLFDDTQLHFFTDFAIDVTQGIRTPFLDSTQLTNYPSYVGLAWVESTNQLFAKIRSNYTNTRPELQTDLILIFSANQLHYSVIEFINWSNAITRVFYEDPEFERANLFRMWNVGSDPDLDDNLVQQEQVFNVPQMNVADVNIDDFWEAT